MTAGAAGAQPRAGGPHRVVLATRNAHKVVELRAVLGPALAAAAPGLAVELLAVGDPSLPDVPEVAEVEVTFAGNALLKARAVAAATGLVALADDSGIAVDVLGGSPGVLSARWAGRHGDDAANLALLLAQLAEVPDAHRGAAFVCAAALVVPGGPGGSQEPAREHVEQAELRGALLREPRGARGFGYDPAFVPDGWSQTLAEVEPAAKDATSHRGRAFRALAPHLAAALSSAPAT